MEASADLTRWRVEAWPNVHAGEMPETMAPRWRVTLEKNREGRTEEWSLAWNSGCKAFEHVPDTCSAKGTGFTHCRATTGQMGQSWRLGPRSDAPPIVVVDTIRNALRIVACDEHAASLGIKVG
ncbi:hypothetical protein [Breoghania sp.]|uniref:hypothetical protein n=1 Tax=Breoghania sp. TaxID=2065378 RepID=UPI00260B4EBC|nr:hypothetical protein [Breoghania sp.]MDJ0930788.1 hypothetical protein [Breoghania sp.]